MVLLKFDINKINTLVSNKSLNKENITNEEYEFMRNIYNFIIDIIKICDIFVTYQVRNISL